MKYISKVLVLAFLLISQISLAQIKIPEESQFSSVTQEIGFTEIKIEYTRPSMKGRTIFGTGEMIPYGTVWRTGANANTKFEISKDVFLNDNRIPAGKYALYSIPGPSEWTIIINTDTTLWGHYGYDQAKDFLRFTVIPEKTLDHHETLAIGFENANDKRATLEITWGNHRIPIELKIDEKAQDLELVAEIQRILALPEDRDKPIMVAHDYFDAARYYGKTKRGTEEQILKWYNHAIALEDVSYFHLFKAEFLGSKKRYTEAIESSKAGLKIFMKTGNNKEWIWRYETQIAEFQSLLKKD